MDFSKALIEVRLGGSKISRESWGSDEYVVYQRGYPQGIAINANTSEATGIREGSTIVFGPYLMIWTEGAFVPWTPSMTDVLALDWRADPLTED